MAALELASLKQASALSPFFNPAFSAKRAMCSPTGFLYLSKLQGYSYTQNNRKRSANFLEEYTCSFKAALFFLKQDKSAGLFERAQRSEFQRCLF